MTSKVQLVLKQAQFLLAPVERVTLSRKRCTLMREIVVCDRLSGSGGLRQSVDTRCTSRIGARGGESREGGEATPTARGSTEATRCRGVERDALCDTLRYGGEEMFSTLLDRCL
jgi:hypothetical protein